jgi:peptidyl-prolyl cis-trans isomerase B (cyclophilin B)
LSKSKNISAAAASRLSGFQAKQELEVAKSKRRKDDNRKALLISAAAVVLAIFAQFSYFSFGPGSVEKPFQNAEIVPKPEIAENRTWIGSVTIGEAELEFELDGVNAPQAVANFVKLTTAEFFEGISCHRLVTDGIYVLQCGDPVEDGSGGPGYTWGPLENTPEDDRYTEGVLAMARRGGDGASMGSQFFIVYQDSRIPSDAAGGYTVFGKITAGLDSLKPIIDAGVEGGATDGKPVANTMITRIEVK